MASDHGRSGDGMQYGVVGKGVSEGRFPVEGRSSGGARRITRSSQRDLVLASVLAGIPANGRRNGAGSGDRNRVEPRH